jgi:hypothetical protein
VGNQKHQGHRRGKTYELKIDFASALQHRETFRASEAARKVKSGIARLAGWGLRVPPTRNAKAIKNYPRGVGTIKCIEMNASHVVIQKIVTLFQGEVNTHAFDHFRIIFTSL